MRSSHYRPHITIGGLWANILRVAATRRAKYAAGLAKFKLTQDDRHVKGRDVALWPTV